MAGEQTSIEADEFDRWLTPHAALRILKHFEYRTAVVAILNRIQSDDIQAAARKATRKVRGAIWPPQYFWIVPRGCWNGSGQAQSNSSFWQTGDVTFVLSRHNPGTYDSTDTVACIDIRFEPDGIMRLIPATPTIAPTTPQARKVIGDIARVLGVESPFAATPAIAESPRLPKRPKVAKSVLAAWYAQFATANPGAVERVVIAAAKAQFPKNSISRQPIRDLMGPRKRGNPAIRRK